MPSGRGVGTSSATLLLAPLLTSESATRACSRRSDASKLALVHLDRQLAAWNFGLLDCQVASEHLQRLGARTLPRADFLVLLREAAQRPAPPEWQFDPPRAGDPAHLPDGAMA